jgi:hypothetical protein
VVHGLSLLSVGQDRVPHWLEFAHVTSQAHALSHVTLPHAPGASHVTVHAPSLQCTLPHAFGAVQLIVHANPGGHITLPHCPGLVQSTVHVLAVVSHDVHGAGQPLPSGMPITQKPWTHVRPGSHAPLGPHCRSSERRWTQQPASATSTRAVFTTSPAR